MKRFILQKTSKQGVVYFWNGKITIQRNDDASLTMIAHTSLFPADAEAFEERTIPESRAAFLNEKGIGGADWCVVELGQAN